MFFKIIKFIFSLLFGFYSFIGFCLFISFLLIPFDKTSSVHFSFIYLFMSLLSTIICFFISYWLSNDIRLYYSQKVPILTHESGYKFAGFNRRFVAGIIDSIIFIPLFFFPYFLKYSSALFYVLMFSLSSVLGYFYILAFMSWRGQTIGKMLTKVKVTKIGGQNICFKNAFFRSSVDIGITALNMIWFISMIPAIHPKLGEMTYTEMEKLFSSAYLDLVINVLLLVWLLSEYITLLFNKKRSAIHDYIAGTVVLDLNTHF